VLQGHKVYKAQPVLSAPWGLPGRVDKSALLVSLAVLAQLVFKVFLVYRVLLVHLVRLARQDLLVVLVQLV
jgi:hypothetical protein